jgi:hypothetical protein
MALLSVVGEGGRHDFGDAFTNVDKVTYPFNIDKTSYRNDVFNLLYCCYNAQKYDVVSIHWSAITAYQWRFALRRPAATAPYVNDLSRYLHGTFAKETQSGIFTDASGKVLPQPVQYVMQHALDDETYRLRHSSYTRALVVMLSLMLRPAGELWLWTQDRQTPDGVRFLAALHELAAETAFTVDTSNADRIVVRAGDTPVAVAIGYRFAHPVDFVAVLSGAARPVCLVVLCAQSNLRVAKDTFCPVLPLPMELDAAQKLLQQNDVKWPDRVCSVHYGYYVCHDIPNIPMGGLVRMATPSHATRLYVAETGPLVDHLRILGDGHAVGCHATHIIWPSVMHPWLDGKWNQYYIEHDPSAALDPDTRIAIPVPVTATEVQSMSWLCCHGVSFCIIAAMHVRSYATRDYEPTRPLRKSARDSHYRTIDNVTRAMAAAGPAVVARRIARIHAYTSALVAQQDERSQRVVNGNKIVFK